tara:strand:- start:70792 stop:70905 length:114 start_codon:yes stop_codon:yes gene_type:complete
MLEFSPVCAKAALDPEPAQQLYFVRVGGISHNIMKNS